jgi:UDP-2,4-diacetamido-2,4,6-trideoxy-beta-L-altropyranose hydrolase
VRVVFRADASLEIGTGHVMRCMTLADELRRRGATATFICREQPGNLIELIRSRGFEAEAIAHEDASPSQVAQLRPDWVVVDHYGLGRAWETAVRPATREILAIDDLGDRDHDCDLLLDQNLYDGVEQRYASRLPAHCRQLIGPHYALLRPEFVEARARLSRRAAKPVSRLLISFGGIDATNETARVLKALADAPAVSLDVVIGPGHPNHREIEKLTSERPGTTLHVGTNRMAALMAEADAFVGAGGSTTWERFCLGLPSLVIAVADNQVATAQHLSKLGAIDYIGRQSDLTSDGLRAALSRFLADDAGRARMTELGMKVVDGLGAQRVAQAMLDLTGA